VHILKLQIARQIDNQAAKKTTNSPKQIPLSCYFGHDSKTVLEVDNFILYLEMGNANGHVSDRRKSLSGGAPSAQVSIISNEFNPHSAHNANVGSPVIQPLGAIGPVDITKGTNGGNSKSPSKILATGSAFSKTVLGFRPRATTADSGSYNRPRPRATTVSHGSSDGSNSRAQYAGPRKYASVDGDNVSSSNLSPSEYPFQPHKMDAATAAFIASCKEKEGATKKLPTIFKYNGDGKEVFVCGSFNNWQKLKMSRSTKDFVAIVDLKEGEHEYKFLVDGEWVNDPNEPKKDAKDEHGFLVTNNLIRVQKEDFDAYHALDMDSKAVALAQQNLKKHIFADTFNQEIPQYVTERTEHRTGPPILPPHLLQVILNKDTPLSCEPTLLPEPNHVMLNHLYALSIKDGVMVLSSTQRYRRKYVTTLLYKPMGVRKS